MGLSEITWIGHDSLLVVERDNQQRDAAQVKRLYSVSVAGITPAAAGDTSPELPKTLVRDLLVEDDYRLEKIEGTALTKFGTLLVVNDNDGVGETRLLRLRGVISSHPRRETIGPDAPPRCTGERSGLETLGASTHQAECDCVVSYLLRTFLFNCFPDFNLSAFCLSCSLSKVHAERPDEEPEAFGATLMDLTWRRSHLLATELTGAK